MNLQDFDRVLAAIPNLNIRKWMDEDIMMLFKILYWLALRPDEGIPLTKSQFNFKNRTVNLYKTKTRKNDVALIPARFVDELEAWINEKLDEKLFISYDGETELTYDTFYRWLKKLGKMLDIEAWTTPQRITGEKTVGHIFRKSVGKEMLDGEIKTNDGKNFEIDVISKHLRHSKPSMTVDHYLKASLSKVAQSF